ncbi:hypothetical protein NDU88_004496 [Pleurodeles waltl]|uniref:Uncharacterized protein n=1 Tax=Pleurodeles waltl TaxID=8319 RepID=A0AAV7T9W8_PLEWA|nr:hypothetical protein NDU88_004496 [Pleurodeles waltl]
MILIIETAKELMETLMKEIQALEEELKKQDSVQEVKKQLEIINQELESFNLYLVKRKTDKLRKTSDGSQRNEHTHIYQIGTTRINSRMYQIKIANSGRTKK